MIPEVGFYMLYRIPLFLLNPLKMIWFAAAGGGAILAGPLHSPGYKQLIGTMGNLCGKPDETHMCKGSFTSRKDPHGTHGIMEFAHVRPPQT